MPLSKSSGKDLIIAFWFKKLHFWRDIDRALPKHLRWQRKKKETLPTWLTKQRQHLSQKTSILTVPKIIDQ